MWPPIIRARTCQKMSSRGRLKTLIITLFSSLKSSTRFMGELGRLPRSCPLPASFKSRSTYQFPTRLIFGWLLTPTQAEAQAPAIFPLCRFSLFFCKMWFSKPTRCLVHPRAFTAILTGYSFSTGRLEPILIRPRRWQNSSQPMRRRRQWFFPFDPIGRARQILRRGPTFGLSSAGCLATPCSSLFHGIRQGLPAWASCELG